MKVYLRQVPDSRFVAFVLTVGAGSRTEGPFLESGISHLIEHLVFRGTDQGFSSEIGKRIEQYGGDINAYTTADCTLYYIRIPREQINIALDIFLESLLHPSFDQTSVENEKQVVLHEVQMGLDDTDRVLHKLFWKTAYHIHPYQVKTIGEESLLKALTPDNLIQYFEKMYVPSNMSLTAVGDFEKDEILVSIFEKFSSLQRKSFEFPVVAQEPPSIGLRRSESFGSIQLTHWMMGFHIPSFQDPDFIPLDVIATFLAKGSQSPLRLKLEYELSVAKSVEAETSPLMDPGMLTIRATCEDKNIPLIEVEIDKILEKLKRERISIEELNRAKKRILSDFYQELESIEKQALLIGVSAFLTGDATCLEEYIKKIQAVSQEDILRVAQKYFSLDRKVISVLRPQKAQESIKEDSIQKMRLKPSVKQLSNGIWAIVGEDHALPIVSIQALCKGGLGAETAQNNGIFQLIANTAIRGTKSKSGEEILGSVEAQGGTLSGFSEFDAFGFSMRIPKDFLKEGLFLISDIFQNATLALEDLEKEKSQLLLDIQEVKETPILWALFQLKQNLWSQHPYRFLKWGSENSIKALTQEEVVKVFREYCIPSHLIISISGDVASPEVFKLIEEAFSNFVSTQKELKTQGNFEDRNEALKICLNSPQAQSLVMMGFLGAKASDADSYGLELLAKLFSGLCSSLSEKLRTQAGSVYQLGAENFLGLDRGFFVIYAGTSLEKEPEVEKTIQSALEEVMEGKISKEDLLRAQNQAIAEKIQDWESLTFRAREAAYFVLNGVGIEEFDQYRQKIMAWDEKALAKIAKKYFKEGRSVFLTVSPEQKNNK